MPGGSRERKREHAQVHTNTYINKYIYTHTSIAIYMYMYLQALEVDHAGLRGHDAHVREEGAAQEEHQHRLGPQGGVPFLVVNGVINMKKWKVYVCQLVNYEIAGGVPFLVVDGDVRLMC